VELNSVALAENSVSRADQKCNVIMHGAKPADLPVAGANQFDFVTNLKTAKALGLSLLKTRFERIDGAAR
jgi:ABC-type uncharacterized transport system substrate-binding protein